MAVEADERWQGIRRPVIDTAVFWDMHEALRVGVECPVLMHDEFGEYGLIPQVQRHAAEHLELMVGGGWFQEEGEDQAAFMVRTLITQPSPRKPCEDRVDAHCCDRGWQGGVGWLLERL